MRGRPRNCGRRPAASSRPRSASSSPSGTARLSIEAVAGRGRRGQDHRSTAATRPRRDLVAAALRDRGRRSSRRRRTGPGAREGRRHVRPPGHPPCSSTPAPSASSAQPARRGGQREPGLLDAFRERLLGPRRAQLVEAILRRGVAARRTPPGRQTRCSSRRRIAGAIFGHHVILGEPTTEAWNHLLVDHVWSAIEAR